MMANAGGDYFPWQIIQNKLNQCDNQDIDDICTSCFNLLLKHPNDSSNSSVVVRTLAQLVRHAIKHNQTDSDLESENHFQQLQPYFRQRFQEMFRTHRQALMTMISAGATTDCSYPHYIQLKWRFEIKLAGKYLRRQFLPYVILSFYTKNHRNQIRCLVVKCTIADLYHIKQKIADAVERNNSQHSAKLIRNIKL